MYLFIQSISKRYFISKVDSSKYQRGTIEIYLEKSQTEFRHNASRQTKVFSLELSVHKGNGTFGRSSRHIENNPKNS